MMLILSVTLKRKSHKQQLKVYYNYFNNNNDILLYNEASDKEVQFNYLVPSEG